MSSHFTCPEFTPGLESSKTLFSLNQGVTRDSRVTPGLPLDSKTRHKCASQPKIARKSLKTHIFGVHGRSRSSMLVPPESSSAVVVMISSKSASIGNHSRARLVDSSRNRTFSRGCPNLMRSYGGLLEPRGSNLTPSKSTFTAEYFVCRLSWSILNGLGAIQS